MNPYESQARRVSSQRFHKTAADGAQGSVGGVGGPVDLDVAVRDYPAIMRARGLNGFEPPFESNGEEASEMIYETVGDVPAWARPTVEKLLAKGFLKGTESGLDLNETMLRLLVINDRAGLYGA